MVDSDHWFGGFCAMLIAAATWEAIRENRLSPYGHVGVWPVMSSLEATLNLADDLGWRVHRVPEEIKTVRLKPFLGMEVTWQ